MPVPKDEKKLSKAPAEKPVSRIRKLIAAGTEPQMPPLSAPHIVQYLYEVGPVMPGGMGPVPISFGELKAWQEQVGIDLQPWEARLLRRLSHDYLAASQEAEDPSCPPPFGEQQEIKRAQQVEMQQKIDLFLG